MAKDSNVAEFPTPEIRSEDKFTEAEAQSIFEVFSNLQVKLGDPGAQNALATFEAIKAKLPKLSNLREMAASAVN